MLFVRAIRRQPSITANAIPLYLPPDNSTSTGDFDENVFFGAISMYLREKVPFMKGMPDFFDKIFDSAPLLKLASRQAGTTRTEGLEDLTLSMIKGENAFRQHEVDRLVKYLNSTGKPDIIHLSNALIIGLARQLKRRMNVKVVCSLLNEDDWIEEMVEPYRSKAWKMIAAEARNIDSFVTPSKYYNDLFLQKTGLKNADIHIVPLGIDPGMESGIRYTRESPSIGYLSRISHMNGFDKLVDAFISLKKEERLPGLTLHVCGGYTGDDKSFIREQIKKIKENGFKSSVRLYPDFNGHSREKFFKSIDVMSVPVRKYDGFGLYILEANAAGVPVVQPSTGAFPEIIGSTGGGVIYTPDDPVALASSIYDLLINNESIQNYGSSGFLKVRELFSLDKMSQMLMSVYNKTI